MDIGSAIRTIRKQKQITIMQLCEGTGLSKGFISNVENNKTSPSIATLESIADYLNVPLPYLLLTPEQRMNVVRKHERQETTAGSGQIKVQHLTAKGPCGCPSWNFRRERRQVVTNMWEKRATLFYRVKFAQSRARTLSCLKKVIPSLGMPSCRMRFLISEMNRRLC